MSKQSDIKTLVNQVLTNLNGKHIYDKIVPLASADPKLVSALAAALEVPVSTDAEHSSPFVLVVDTFNNVKAREKYWDYDYAVLYTLPNQKLQPTYSVRELDSMNDMPDEAEELTAEDHVRGLLDALGEDVSREGLLETPKRVVKFYKEFLSPAKFNFTVFDSEKYDELIVQKDIPFFSLCEHHMAPFFGTATVAYIPNGKIVGLSKLARCVDHYSRKFQNQERITTQIANRLQEELEPVGVAVLLEARHFCMEMRGIKTHDVSTTTSKLIGAFKDEPEARAEFFSIAKGK